MKLTALTRQVAAQRVALIIDFLLDVGALHLVLPFGLHDLRNRLNQSFAVPFASLRNSLAFFQDDRNDLPLIQRHLNSPPVYINVLLTRSWITPSGPSGLPAF